MKARVGGYEEVHEAAAEDEHEDEADDAELVVDAEGARGEQVADEVGAVERGEAGGG